MLAVQETSSLQTTDKGGWRTALHICWLSVLVQCGFLALRHRHLSERLPSMEPESRAENKGAPVDHTHRCFCAVSAPSTSLQHMVCTVSAVTSRCGFALCTRHLCERRTSQAPDDQSKEASSQAIPCVSRSVQGLANTRRVSSALHFQHRCSTSALLICPGRHLSTAVAVID